MDREPQTEEEWNNSSSQEPWSATAEPGEIWGASNSTGVWETDGSSETWNSGFENQLRDETWDPESRNSREQALEKFLDIAQSAGARDSEGAFTISREQARRKLGHFQLHSPGHWAVKSVQFIVGTGSTSAIWFTTTRKFIQIKFDLGNDFDPEQFERQFFGGNVKPQRPWNYLLATLWSTGVGEKRPFILTLAGSDTEYRWSGSELTTKTSINKRQTQLTIYHNATETGPRPRISARARKKEVEHALRVRCFVCPLPLTIDGQRLDALQLCAHHGWGPSSHPLLLGFVTAPELETWKIPPGTYSDISKRRKNLGRLFGRPVADEMRCFNDRTSHERASCSFMVSWHGELDVQDSWNAQKGLLSNWVLRKRESKCFFVQDGGVVGATSLGLFGSCSLSLCLSAAGLETDLTGLEIIASEEATERSTRAVVLALDSIEDRINKPEFYGHKTDFRNLSFFFAGLIGAATLLTSALSVFLAPIPLSMGLLVFPGREALKKSIPDTISSDFTDLIHSLSTRYKDGVIEIESDPGQVECLVRKKQS